MKKLWLILLMAMMIMIGAGCQDTQPEEEVETLGKEAAFELSQLFPMEKDFTCYYDGTLDYGDYRTIVDIQENRNEIATYIFMEGEVDDPSGGEAGDTSFLKKIKVFDSGIDLAFSDEWIPLLKAPLKEGHEWTGFWYDQLMGAYGNMTAKTTITEITDTTITTELTPQDENKIYKDYKVITTYEVGKGIVSQTFTYPNEPEPYNFEIWLSKTSKIPENYHIRRYVNPENNLDQFYKLEDSFYKALIADTKQWLMSEKDLTDKNIEKKYDDMIKQLPWNDFKSISTAKEITYLLSQEMADSESIVTKFIQYYEDVINEFNSTDIGQYLSYEEIDRIYVFDESDYSVNIDMLSDFEDPSLRAKAVVLYENGISVSSTEGMYYFTHQKGFIYDQFVDVVSDHMKEYLELKDWYYGSQPIICEGYLCISLDELVNQLMSLEAFSKKYSSTEQAKWAEEEAEFLLNIYIVPGGSWVYSDLSQVGKLGNEYINSYEKFIDEHKDSSYHELVNSVYTFLKNNYFLYSLELDQYLKEKGFEPYLNEEVYNALAEQEKQLEDFKALMETKENIDIHQNEKQITVKNGEELMNAIASNTTIYLEPGVYLLPYSYTSGNVNIDYGEVRFNNIENLVIVGTGEEPVTVMSEAYGEVFTLYDCNNVSFCNLRIGHLQPYCKGGVIEIGDCKGFTLNECILFGCGYWGLEARGSQDITIANTLISDCNTFAVSLGKDENVTFKNCAFKRNGQNVVRIDTCTGVAFEKVEISDNNEQSYGENSVFSISNSQDIKAVNCTFTNNVAEELVNNKEYLTIENQE